jgi:hypothetical protein
MEAYLQIWIIKKFTYPNANYNNLQKKQNIVNVM